MYPLWLVVGHIVALACARDIPFAALTAVAAAIPVLGMLSWRSVWAVKTNVQGVAFIGLLAVTGMGIGALIHPPMRVIHLWRCGEILGCSALVIGCAYGFSQSPVLALSVYRAGAAIAVLTSLVVGLWHQHGFLRIESQWSSIGAGNVAWLADWAAIIAIASATWMAHALWLRQRVMLSDAMLIPGMLVAVAWISIATGRRGPLVIAVAIIAAHILWMAWKTRFRWAMPLFLVVVLAALMFALPPHQFQAGGSERGERIHYFMAGLDIIRSTFPWGGGGCAAATQASASGESARHFLATGTSIISFHNVLLDSIADGGLATLAAVVALIGLWWRRCHDIADPALKWHFITIGLGVLVAGMFDNLFSHGVGMVHCAILLGILIALSPAGSPPRSGILVSRMVLVVGGLCGAIMMCSILPAVGIADSDGIYEKNAAARHTSAPYVLAPMVQRLQIDALRQDDMGVLGEVLGVHDAKMGATPSSAKLAAHCAARIRDPGSELAAWLRHVRMQPFSLTAYHRLGQLIVLLPESQKEIPVHIQARMAVLAGGLDSGVRLSNPDDVRSIEMVATVFVSIAGRVRIGSDWVDTLPSMNLVVSSFGDIPDVAQLAVLFAVHNPEGSFEMVRANQQRLHNGLRYADPTYCLQAIKDTSHAKRCWPVLRLLFGDDARYCSRVGPELRRIGSMLAAAE
ncbi:MAG: O-antigen ligase family protein [Planctomycetes bacterium]|nr:O-antigen ligase family protein [Planctomycetota bacterium]